MKNGYMPMRAALLAAETTFARLHHLLGQADLKNLMEAVGVDLADHFPPRPGGEGVGLGRARSISIPAAVMVAVATRLVERRVGAADAMRIAGAFAFLGEMGDGLRAIVPSEQAHPRAPGTLFPADLGQTLLLVIPAALARPEAPAVAIVPAGDLTGSNLPDWLGENAAEGQGVVMVNLSEVVSKIEAAATASALMAA